MKMSHVSTKQTMGKHTTLINTFVWLKKKKNSVIELNTFVQFMKWSEVTRSAPVLWHHACFFHFMLNQAYKEYIAFFLLCPILFHVLSWIKCLYRIHGSHMNGWTKWVLKCQCLTVIFIHVFSMFILKKKQRKSHVLTLGNPWVFHTIVDITKPCSYPKNPLKIDGIDHEKSMVHDILMDVLWYWPGILHGVPWGTDHGYSMVNLWNNFVRAGSIKYMKVRWNLQIHQKYIKTDAVLNAFV